MKIVLFSQKTSEEINENSLKWQIFQTLKEVKLLVAGQNTGYIDCTSQCVS